jgi:hypothetical protein
MEYLLKLGKEKYAANKNGLADSAAQRRNSRGDTPWELQPMYQLLRAVGRKMRSMRDIVVMAKKFKNGTDWAGECRAGSD